MTKALSCFALFMAIVLAATATERGSSQEDRAVDILFIGNSYTGNLRSVFDRFMAEVSPEAHLAYRTGGGWTLIRHVADVAVRQAIASRKWDYVVLQEQSRLPTFDTGSPTYREHRGAVRQLVTWSREAGATPVLYQTWGRRDGDSGSPRRSPDFDAMQAHLTRAYADAARETEAMVVPVGQVWQAVRHADIELGRALHARDGSHASEKGSYLIAATFLRALVKRDAATLERPPGLSIAETATIHKAIDLVLAPRAASPE